MKAKITVTLKEGVLDPQGKAVQQALSSLGFHEVREARIGKYVELSLDGTDPRAAEGRVQEMCEKLLANTVIESFQFKLEG